MHAVIDQPTRRRRRRSRVVIQIAPEDPVPRSAAERVTIAAGRCWHENVIEKIAFDHTSGCFEWIRV
jgi:hypothetical protein